MMSSYLHRTCLTSLIGLGLLIMMMMLPGSDGAITVPPSNTAVLNGTSNVTMSCASDQGYQFVSWYYLPVGGSSPATISTGTAVIKAQSSSYTVQVSGSDQINLVIFSASPARAGTYQCSEGGLQESAQLIVISSDPVCTMTPNAPTELLWNQAVQMSCSLSFTANTSYVNVNMTWSKDSSTANIQSSTQITNSSTLTTVASNITQTPGNFTPFPVYRCNTTFGIVGNLQSGAATNAPGYSKTTPLFNSPINVIYLNQANSNTITGAKSGDQVYLGTTVTCNVDANPAANYSWLDVTYGNTTNSSSIQIWNDGVYTCTAWNRAASTSASINVTTQITTAAPTTSTTTTRTTTSTISPPASPGASGAGGDTTQPSASTGNDDGLSDTNKIIIGVVVGVGGALVIAAVTILICCCMKKKNKADKYASGSREGTLSKPPPYDDNGHHGPQRLSNPDLVQGYQMDDYPKNFSPYSTTNIPQDRPYIEEEGLNYAQIQLDNNPRSRQPLQLPAEETNYSDVRLA